LHRTRKSSAPVNATLGVRMKIRDITVAKIREGKNWRFVVPESEDWIELPMEEWGPLLEASAFHLNDRVVYSGLIAYPSGRVKPIILFKEVGDLDYGGDYCEFVDGRWRQVGLIPNPSAEIGQEFIANPLAIDKSFSNDEYREHHRRGFAKYVGKL
jgi:hypothetical protein